MPACGGACIFGNAWFGRCSEVCNSWVVGPAGAPVNAIRDAILGDGLLGPGLCEVDCIAVDDDTDFVALAEGSIKQP